MFEIATRKDGKQACVKSRGPAGGLYVIDADSGETVFWPDEVIGTVETHTDGEAPKAPPVSAPNEWVKLDYDKPRVDLLPVAGLFETAKVMAYGAKKYAEHGWKRGGDDAPGRYTAAALRHILAHVDGEANDQESGLPHLAHAAASCLIALALLARKGNP